MADQAVSLEVGMTEVTIILDSLMGTMHVEGPDHLPPELQQSFSTLLGSGIVMGCARPLSILPPPAATEAEITATPCVRIAGYYHNSLVEGPGRRSSVLFQSCPLRCHRCWTPELHSPHAGVLVPVDRLAAALLDPAHERDGISILGGEPTVQPDALLALIQALRSRGCPHILCYSGYTYETLRKRAQRHPAIGAALDDLDMLIDGRYVEALSRSAGPWTDSGNQRVIAATRSAERTRALLGDIEVPIVWDDRLGRNIRQE